MPVPDTFKATVLSNHLFPQVEKEIKSTIAHKDSWGKAKVTFAVFSGLATAIQTFLSFVNIQYQSPYVNMGGAALGITTFLGIIGSHYSDKQQNKIANKVEEILKNINIPVTLDESATNPSIENFYPNPTSV